jgi:tripeptide aminopeptidase
MAGVGAGMIQEARLVETFMALTRIASPSRREGRLAEEVSARLRALGAVVVEDNSRQATGSETGNLVARIPGKAAVGPLMLNAHLDTVEPCQGVRPILQSGVITGAGDTILGADDKSALAIILETLTVLREHGIAHGPLEVVLTTCEEIGLLGAKHLDSGLVDARWGFALDARDPEGLVTRAPSANRLHFRVRGQDAHAGAAPEEGINAIALAAAAIQRISLGRLDAETTCNIGTIRGGLATNIVPPEVEVAGEARSHDEAKLEAVTNAMVAAFGDVVEEHRVLLGRGDTPGLEHRVERDFTRFHLPDGHPVVRLAQSAAKSLGREIHCKTTGGGSDANVFFQKGIPVGVLGTGMRDVHTVRESIAVADMIRCAELVLAILKLHATGTWKG